MANVTYECPEYKNNTKIWETIRDCLAGDHAVKQKREKYLPSPSPEDLSEANKRRYLSYLRRAVFYNVTYRTLIGLSGQVFQAEPTIEVPALLLPLLEDTDGKGLSLAQQMRKVAGLVLAYGRCGLLIDYPVTNGSSSLADLSEGNIRPTITCYEPWKVINWRTGKVGSKVYLSLVVIEEEYIITDDGFQATTAKQYRVLRLDDEGYYKVELWRNSKKGYTIYFETYPTAPNGLPFTEIPFVFIGAQDNDPDVDRAPLYDLAVLNLAHYINSADYEEACHITGQPTPYFSGLTKTWVSDVLKGTIQLGSRGAVPLPEGGSAGLLQPSPNTMPKEAMESKERQMVAIGAKLVEQVTQQRTATEVERSSESEVSHLSSCVGCIEAGYTWALYKALAFISETQVEITVDLNPSYKEGALTTEERRTLVSEWLQGAITFVEMRDGLRRSGIAFEGDEIIKKPIQHEPSSGSEE